jgi:hypothetical protein
MTPSIALISVYPIRDKHGVRSFSLPDAERALLVIDPDRYNPRSSNASVFPF